MVLKALMYKATMHRLKTFFLQSTLLFNLHLSHLSGILLRINVFLVMGRGPEKFKEKKKTERRKTLKSEEKKKPRIRGKSNNSNIHMVTLQVLKV